jgi:TM2 domain-containing membrane protein YozV
MGIGLGRHFCRLIARISSVSKAAVTASNQPSLPVVELKDPIVAAALGWLVPGLGHIYQGRTPKGLLFMICILSTFFFGLVISDGKAVYASWRDNDKRLPYLCQVGVGLPALPALVQTYLVREGKAPLLGGVMAPPATPAELNEWYKTLHRYFELGTVYTMIAGLLNILAIYDAWGGPVAFDEEDEKRKQEPNGQVTPASG